MGIDKRTSPPPCGGAPRLSIFSSNPSDGTPNCFNNGKVVEWKVSTHGSLESFVIPENNLLSHYKCCQRRKALKGAKPVKCPRC